MLKQVGKVYLVGAGPGDPGLITVKGLDCLKEAEVIIYDRLVNPILLAEAKEEVELIYVGKTANQHTLTQEEINQLICREAKAGKVVVRLKGGDPFIFGRGGEELEELIQNGIPFEVVPGITSAIAVPTYAGIPLTHRDYCSTVSFITGHENPLKGESAITWEGLARGTGTLVFLMGVSNLDQIVQCLQQNGRDAKTPVAVIQWGTRSEQSTVSGRLDNIIEQVQKIGITSPAVIVVGEVVNFREQFNWFEQKPLFGKRVLVTRARAQASELTRALQRLGAEVIESPAIEIIPPVDWQQVDRCIVHLSSYQWVIFTSVNGVKYFIQHLFDLGMDVRALKGVKLAAIGLKTAQKLMNYGLKVDYIPEEFIAEKLAAGLIQTTELAGAKILLARAMEVRTVLAETLRQAGAEVDEVVVYRTVLGLGRGNLVDLLLNGQIQIVTFTSSSTVENMVEQIKPLSLAKVLENVTVACIGPITANTVKRLGGHVDIIADEYSIIGLVESLQNQAIQKCIGGVSSESAKI